MNTIKRLLLLVLSLAALPALGEGSIEPGMPPGAFSRVGRAFFYHVPAVRNQVSPTAAGSCTVNSSTVAADTALTKMGKDGWVMDAAYSSVSITWTSSIGLPLYPGRLMYDIYDGGTAATLSCTSLTIIGYRWDGALVTERIAPLTETVGYTANSFREVISVAARGCANWSDSSTDRLRLRSSRWVAMPYKISSYNDIDAVCTVPTTNGFASTTAAGSYMKCLSPSSTTFNMDFTPAGNAVDTMNLADGVVAPSVFPLGHLYPVGAGCAPDRASFTFRGRANAHEPRF